MKAHDMNPRGEAQTKRGKLRIYLGAAPGVGKTWAMLAEGHRLNRDGLDVVAGVIETHGRSETAAQVGDLELIPLRTISHRGLDIAELDVEAVLQRAPDVVLIDEMAHTNAPGSARPKRWQDVEVIRDAGIDVVSALNIQHLESLNHIVESITGIAVRETVPDQVLAEASEVQLIDLPVEGLLERLEAGKIYPPERVTQALGNFFRAGNLTALRELALRQTAAGVDEQLAEYMHQHAIDEIWPAAERIGVVISSEPGGPLVRAGWRFASALRTDLLVIVPEPSGWAPSERVGFERNIALAEDLGGRIHFVDRRDDPAALAEVIRRENVNLLVLPQSGAQRPRFRGLSLVDGIFALVDNLQIVLVESRAESQ